jgi:hypothetical protein
VKYLHNTSDLANRVYYVNHMVGDKNLGSIETEGQAGSTPVISDKNKTKKTINIFYVFIE